MPFVKFVVDRTKQCYNEYLSLIRRTSNKKSLAVIHGFCHTKSSVSVAVALGVKNVTNDKKSISRFFLSNLLFTRVEFDDYGTWDEYTCDVMNDDNSSRIKEKNTHEMFSIRSYCSARHSYAHPANKFRVDNSEYTGTKEKNKKTMK